MPIYHMTNTGPNLRRLVADYFSRIDTWASLLSLALVACALMFFLSDSGHYAFLAAVWIFTFGNLAHAPPPRSLQILPVSQLELARFFWLSRFGMTATIITGATVLGWLIVMLLPINSPDWQRLTIYLFCAFGGLGLYAVALTFIARFKGEEEPMIFALAALIVSTALGVACLSAMEQVGWWRWLLVAAVAMGVIALILLSIKPQSLLQWPKKPFAFDEIFNLLFKDSGPDHPLKHQRKHALQELPQIGFVVVGIVPLGIALAWFRQTHSQTAMGFEAMTALIVTTRFMHRRFSLSQVRVLRTLPLTMTSLTARVFLAQTIPGLALVMSYLVTFAAMTGRLDGKTVTLLTALAIVLSVQDLDNNDNPSPWLLFPASIFWGAAVILASIYDSASYPVLLISTSVLIIIYALWRIHRALTLGYDVYRDRPFSKPTV
jgi:hypothetical protein